MQTISEPRGGARVAQSGLENKLDLDALAALDVDALGRLYAAGAVTDVTPLAGRPRGRMLAVRGLDHGAVGRALASFAGSRGFPWGGKSFAGAGARGTGVNRVNLGGRHQLFPFLTSVAPSVVDGRPCVMLDYDLPDNPGLIRKIHDEVRDIGDGLYLGPAMWKGEKAPTFVLWFALDTRVQAPPPGEGRVASTVRPDASVAGAHVQEVRLAPPTSPPAP